MAGLCTVLLFSLCYYGRMHSFLPELIQISTSTYNDYDSLRMYSPKFETVAPAETTRGVPATVPSPPSKITDVMSTEPLLQDGTVKVDNDTDSAHGSSFYLNTTSTTSSIVRGVVENGRRYQTLREGEYWGPSDDKQAPSQGVRVHSTDIG